MKLSNSHKINSTALFDEFIQKVDITVKFIEQDFLVACFREQEMYEAIIQLMEMHKRLLRVYELSSNNLRDRYYNQLVKASVNLYDIVYIYNTLVEHSVSVMHKSININNDLISINNSCIGVTPSGEVDVFKRIIFREPIAMNGNFNIHSYNAGVLYQGILTGHTAIYRLHKDTKFVDAWAGIQAEELIKSRRYQVNTEYLNILGDFKLMHLEMCEKTKNIMSYYVADETTKEEAMKVINYVKQNYDIKKNQKIKKKGI